MAVSNCDRVRKNEILTALNKPEDFILVIVRVDGQATTFRYLERPFKREPDFAAESINYDIEQLLSLEVTA